MRHTRILAIISASILATACSDPVNDIPDGNTQSGTNLHTVTLRAMHDTPTRTDFDGTSTSWVDGDAMSVILDRNGEQQAVRFTLTDAAEGAFEGSIETVDLDAEYDIYAVYPYDGLSLADSPLGYLDNGDGAKEEAFLTLQDYLLSDEVQQRIQRTGRRTGYGAEWGIQPDRVLSPIRMPAADVLFECLDLYQTHFRKPSLTVYCLDYSGSMDGEGRRQLVDAMAQILIQKNARANLLQASEEEINILIPFDSGVRGVYTANGNGGELEGLYTQVESEAAGGGTNLYAAARKALEVMEGYDLDRYTPAIILMTDGMSDGSYRNFRRDYEALGRDIPVFSIMFGDADPEQLEDLAGLTHARVFDGREDLVEAFRSVKGYN